MQPTLLNDVKLFLQKSRVSNRLDNCYMGSKKTLFCHVERFQLKGLLYLMKGRHAYAEAMLQMGKIGKK